MGATLPSAVYKPSYILSNAELCNLSLQCFNESGSAGSNRLNKFSLRYLFHDFCDIRIISYFLIDVHD